MSSFGVTDDGYRLKTVQDILASMEQKERAQLGADISTQPDDALGVVNGVIGSLAAELWAVGQAVYRSAFRASAGGESLDNVGDLTDAIRLAAAPSTVTLRANLDNAAVLAVGKVVSIGLTGARWVVTTGVTNSLGYQDNLEVAFESEDAAPIVGNAESINNIQTAVSGWSAKVALKALTDEPYALIDLQTLSVSVDEATAVVAVFNTADFADITNATAQEVVDSLVADVAGLEGNDAGGFARIASTTDGPGSSLEVTGGTAFEALGFSGGKKEGFNPDLPAQTLNGNSAPYALSDGLTLVVQVNGGVSQSVTFNTGDFVSIGAATAIEVAKVITGDLGDADAYEVLGKVQIETVLLGENALIQVLGGTSNGILGFQTVDFSGAKGDATVGNDLELDPAYRLRQLELLRLPGKGTVEAVRAAVRRVAAVRQSSVFENDSDVDLTGTGGLPPHSLEAVVLDGDDVAIAQAIFDTKPVGTTTYRDPGATGRTETITDSQGDGNDINFSRPTEIRMYVDADITISARDFGDGDQAAGELEVKTAIKNVGDLQQVKDTELIINKFLCAPFTITGVLDSTIMRVEDIPSPTNTANISLTIRELATFSIDDMTLNLTVLP